ncbi:hypothetical protein H4R27_002382 [Coemansia aciculifera]|nr:hypothetical protein H4R27_002382 [Coemansia aciculifera]
MEKKRDFVRPDRLPLVRRIAGPLHNPRRDFTRLPPLPPPPRNRSMRMYGTKSRIGVRQPLAELFALNSEAEKEDSPDPKRRSAPGGLLTMTRRSNQVSSAAVPADAYIVELPPSPLPHSSEKTAPEEDELGLVIAGIRPRYPAVEPAPSSGVLHTTVADELCLLPTKRKRKLNAQ